MKHQKVTFKNRYGISLVGDLYTPEDAFKKLTGDNKELLIIPGASHVDLYDRLDIIPFDKITSFFNNNLK